MTRFHDKPVPPGHIADGRFSQEVVGPIVRFRGRNVPVTVERMPPTNTMDGGRWANCTRHHLACDCREAEHNEDMHEMRMEMRAINDALVQATHGHPTFVELRNTGERRRDLECKCAGCDVIRRLDRTGLRFYENTVTL